MPVADTQSQDTAEPASSAAQDPRKSREVMKALQRASRRDPHPDVFKPIGRICFLISLVLVAWLVSPLAFPHSHSVHFVGVTPHDVIERGVVMLKHLRNAIQGIDNDRLSDLDIEPKQAVTLFIGGIFVFGFYYFALYLVAANTLKTMLVLAPVARASARHVRNAAGRVRKWTRKKDDETEIDEAPARNAAKFE